MAGRLDQRAVLEIIERVYAAAGEPQVWSEVTSACQRQLPGAGFHLLFSSAESELHPISSIAGFDPYFIELYLAHYHATNPYQPLVAKLPSGVVTRVHQAVTREWLLAQPFYHEWLKPAGDFTMGATLPFTDDEGGLFRLTADVPSSRPELEDTAADLLHTIGPHVQRALKVASRMSATAYLSGIGQALLDGLAVPSMVVDARSRIVAISASAERILRQGRTLRATPVGCVIFRSQAAETSFRAALASATRVSVQAAPYGFFVDHEGESTRVLVLPFHKRTALAQVAPARLALVQIGQARGPAQPTELLRTLYRLTKAEAALAQRVAAGESVSEIAEANAVARSTVRNQLQAAMQKLNVHRQAELVGVVASLTPRIDLDARD